MNTKTKFILCIGIVLILAITIFGTSNLKLLASENSNNDTILTKNKNQSKNSKEKIDILEKKLKSYIGSDIDNIGLTYYDLQSGNTIAINADKKFIAASTVKVPMNMVLYDMVKDNKISLYDTLTYDKDNDYEGGTGKLKASQLRSPVSIKTLSDYSILYSDNIAINILIRKIGINNLQHGIELKLGHKIDCTDNYTTASNSAALLKLLYQNSSNNQYYNRLVYNMKHTIFHDRIDKYIPEIITAHKIGDYNHYVNDIAIMYTHKPYILTIFTNNITGANEKIAQISKLIYKYQLTAR